MSFSNALAGSPKAPSSVEWHATHEFCCAEVRDVTKYNEAKSIAGTAHDIIVRRQNKRLQFFLSLFITQLKYPTIVMMTIKATMTTPMILNTNFRVP